MSLLKPLNRLRPRGFPGTMVGLVATGILGLLGAAPGVSQPAAFEADLAVVPAPLVPWVEWVLRDHPEVDCPWLGAGRECVWPGRLGLDLQADGGRFDLWVRADRESSVALPGGPTTWPQQVRVDGDPALLVGRGDQPRVQLSPGRHRISGRFVWPRIPQTLPVPSEVGLVDLRLEGQAVTRLRREQDGLLWLQAGRDPATEQDSVQVEVYRRLLDDIPARLVTHIELQVGGGSREEDLGDVLPSGFEAVRLSGGLPTRLDPDGGLRLQLRPGSWELEILAIHRGRLEAVRRPATAAPWPEAETWVYESVPEVRVAQAGGLVAVDPQRTSLPADWRSLPAFLFAPEAELELVEVRRGAADPPPDSLSGERQFWLAFDGGSFTVSDRFQGSFQQGGRLTPREPAVVGSVEIDGQGQVVTVGAEGRAGVEVRTVESAIGATLTYPRVEELPAVGWDRDARSLQTTLHLPSGWVLVAAPGVDRAAGSWLEAWTLLDLFLLLLIAITGGRLFGRSWGLLTGVGLGLAWHQPWLPRLLWLFLFAALAIERWLAKSGHFTQRHETGKGTATRTARLIRFLRRLALVAMIAQLTFFAGSELRTGLFPHLEDRSFGRSGLSNPAALVASMPVAVPEEMAVLGSSVPRSQNLPAPRKSKRDLYASYDQSQQFDAEAVVQTGPGIPNWLGEVSVLKWSGPVAQDHTFRLWLLSPRVHLLIRFLFLGLLGLITGRLLGSLHRFTQPPGPASSLQALDPVRPTPEPSSEGSAPRLGVWWLLLLVPSLYIGTARAEESRSENGANGLTPEIAALSASNLSVDRLVELEAWLTAPPDCGPQCVELALARVDAGADAVEIELEIHSAARSALPLPGPRLTWSPTRIEVDGVVSNDLRLDRQGYLMLRLEAGVHRVRLEGPAPEALSLQFPLTPRVLEWSGVGWTAEGREDSNAALRLTRDQPLEVEEGEQVTALAAWASVTRVLDLGIPWRVHTRVERKGGLEEGLHLELPLLAGERVTTAGVPVEAGSVRVTFAPGEANRSWTSTLEETEVLELVAAEGEAWTETWVLDCSPVWTCRPEGIPATSIVADGRWRPVFQPWPGENLTLYLQRADAAGGVSTTISRVDWTQRPGRRLAEWRLGVQLKSSRGEEMRWLLPTEAELQSFEIANAPSPARFEDGELVFNLPSGESLVSVEWKIDRQLGLVEQFPSLELGMPVANVNYSLEVPAQRWVLLTGGPRVGPVIGFWQYVLVLLLVAWGLEGIGWTPLRRWDWFLLGLGLTQVHYLAALLAVGWLLVLGRREAASADQTWGYNLAQLGFVAWSLASAGVLYAAIHRGLLLAPEMHIAGAQSTASTLRWFVDRAEGIVDQPWELSVPLWVWRIVMLGWALWLASRLMAWIPWTWQRLTVGGVWRSRPKRSRRRAVETPEAEGPE